MDRAIFTQSRVPECGAGGWKRRCLLPGLLVLPPEVVGVQVEAALGAPLAGDAPALAA